MKKCECGREYHNEDKGWIDCACGECSWNMMHHGGYHFKDAEGKFTSWCPRCYYKAEQEGKFNGA